MIAGGMATLAFVLSYITTAHALTLPTEAPNNLNDVKDDINLITNDLKNAQCGGWSTGPDETPLVSMISQVEGAPGSPPIIYGNLDSGMAATGDYTFPDSARGKTTVCDPRKSTDMKSVYKDGDAPGTKNRSISVNYPYYEDPYACYWPSTTGGPMTPQLCTNFCNWLNETQWQYEDCKPADIKEVLGPDGKPVGWKCEKWSKKWTCSDDWVEGAPNCKQECKGAACRCPGPGCEKSPGNTKPYQSFYRKYTVTTNRMTLGKQAKNPNDLFTSIKSGAHCYGFYSDGNTQRRCVIDETTLADGSTFTSIDGVRAVNKMRGSYLTQTPVDPPAAPNVKRDAGKNYDPKKDYWFPDIGGAFSLLSSLAEKNLSTAFLSVDQARVTSTVQKSTAEPWARGSIIRAFDDTVSNERGPVRTFTEWWQRFTTDAHRLVTPPTVQLRLPYVWNKSVADLDPIRITRTEDPENSRLASIDVQLAASDDMPGIIASYLKQALLLQIEEEKVPVVVPLSSPIELRAYAQRWEEWKKRRLDSSRTVPPEVDTLIASLKDYADRIEKVRELRATLPIMLSKFITYQKKQVLTIAEWEKKNVDAYNAFQEQAKKRLALEERWRTVQAAYLTVTENQVTPWCKNDRYTPPIHTLLEGWLPSYPEISAGIPTCVSTSTEENLRGTNLPTLCLPYEDRNFTFDLSLLKTATGSVKMPVLMPVQLRLTIPTPGDVTEDLTTEDIKKLTLPDLPDLPDFMKDFERNLPTVTVLSDPPLIPPPAKIQNMVELEKSLTQAEAIIRGMGETYSTFWNSIPYDPGNPGTCGGIDMKASDCCGYASGRCQHPETDLLERFTRLTARPGVLLKEDLQNQGIWRVPQPDGLGSVEPAQNATCWAGDHVCQSLLPGSSEPRNGWQAIFKPDGTLDQFIQSLRNLSRQSTLTDDGTFKNAVPYQVTPNEVYPVYDVPKNTTLSPVKP
jgi:hypothetical protein